MYICCLNHGSWLFLCVIPSGWPSGMWQNSWGVAPNSSTGSCCSQPCWRSSWSSWWFTGPRSDGVAMRSHWSEAPRTGCLCKGSWPSLPKRCNDRFDVKIRKVHLTCACSGTVRYNESAGCYYNVILYDFLFLFNEGKNGKDWLRTRRKWPGFCRSKLEPSRLNLRTAYPSYFFSRSPFCHPQPPPSAHGRKMERSASRQRCFKLQTIPFSLSLPWCQNLAM